VDSRKEILGGVAVENFSDTSRFEVRRQLVDQELVCDDGVECATRLAKLQGCSQTTCSVNVVDDFSEEFKGQIQECHLDCGLTRSVAVKTW
jgi:hypothetical protein